jgi:ElaB/YqjD/DUF883 family membrane-anchored ribosome-binding protein
MSEDTTRKLIAELQAVMAEAEALLDDTADYVRDKPWQSLGIAAAVGLVVGVLLGRR